MRKTLICILFYFLLLSVHAQKIVSGPMLGPVELRDAKIWVEVSPEVKSVSLQYSKKGSSSRKTINYKGVLGHDFNPVCFTVGGLEPNTSYEYWIAINGKTAASRGEFTTKDLWQWRKPAPDFNFITGSCFYVNEPVYDRPGKPYGGDSSILVTMAKEKSAFMLWLGDAWYTREVDYFSEWGLWYRASHDRAFPVLQPLLKAMPHVGVWDDHDYGPNNMGKNYVLKEASRRVFMNYFCNPSYGENGEGVYSMMSYSDVDIFLTDSRWFRSPDYIKDSINGRPNPGKRMLGEKQMEWLKNSLIYSNAPFKIIVCGSQVLNPVSTFDKLLDFRLEYDELMNFIADNKINGVLFLTGDRHHSEIIKVDRAGTYPLYDITVSPLTSGTHAFSGPEKNNPYRILGVAEKQNYGRFSFSGPRNDRRLKVEYLGIKGENLGTWEISEKDLKSPR